MSAVIPGMPIPVVGHTPIEYVGAASDSAATVALPPHRAGDLIIIMVYSPNTTPPSLAPGFTMVYASSFASSSLIVGYKIAASSSDTSGNWVGGTVTTCSIYRGASAIGAIGVESGSGTRVVWAAVTPDSPPSIITYYALAGARNMLSETPREVYVQRHLSNVLTNARSVIQETLGPVESIGAYNDVASGTGSIWVTIGMELL